MCQRTRQIRRRWWLSGSFQHQWTGWIPSSTTVSLVLLFCLLRGVADAILYVIRHHAVNAFKWSTTHSVLPWEFAAREDLQSINDSMDLQLPMT
jgi:hypothetical protein